MIMAWSYEPKNTWFFGKTLAKLGQECLKHQFEGQETFLAHQSIFQQWRNLPNNAFGQVWPRKCREDAKFPISKIFLLTWKISLWMEKDIFLGNTVKCQNFRLPKASNIRFQWSVCFLMIRLIRSKRASSLTSDICWNSSKLFSIAVMVESSICNRAKSSSFTEFSFATVKLFHRFRNMGCNASQRALADEP